MKRGGLAVVTGHGRIVYVGGTEYSAEVIEHTVASGVYKYPNGDPRLDRVWSELHGHERVFKDEFLEADRRLGLHTHSGGPAFIALARYLVAIEKGRQVADDLRVSLSRENLLRSGAVYAIGIQAVADVVVAIDNGSIDVPYLMSTARMNILRAVLSGDACVSESGNSEDEIAYELEASGYRVEYKDQVSGARIEYRALERSIFTVLNGSAVMRVGNSKMALYGPGSSCELDQWDTLEMVAGDQGVRYIQAVHTKD